MKYILLTTFALLLSIQAYSQKATYSHGMQLYGFTNESGEWIIKPQYKFACDFSDGLAAVENNSGTNKLFGFITENNNISIPYKYDNVHADGFNNGVASVAIGDMWGLIDKKGSVIIPFKYHNPITASDRNDDGYTIWKSIGAYSSVFVTSPQNKILLEGYIFSMDISFLNDEKLLLSVSKSGKYGVYDLNGKVIAECKYDEISKFDSNGLARFRIDDKYGLMDTSFKEVVCSDYRIEQVYPMGRIKICKGITGSPNYRCGIMDMNGEVLVPVKYKYIDSNIDSFPIKVRNENGDYGLLDENWNEISVAKSSDKTTYPDSKYQVATPSSKHSQISVFNKFGLAIVNSGDTSRPKRGAIDKDGNIVIKPKYHDFSDFDDYGEAIVSIFNGTRYLDYGVIDTLGNSVIPQKFDKIHERTGPIRKTQKGVENSALATMGNIRYGAYAGNNEIIPCIYNSVEYDTKSDLILVSIIDSKGDEKYGYMNIEGAVILKCKYSSKEDAYKKAIK